MRLPIDTSTVKFAAAGASEPFNVNHSLSCLSVSEAARTLGISKSHLYDLIAGGEIPAIRLGRRIVIPANKLAEAIDLG
jgi:excisionase family DNA binding protein